MLLKLIVIVPLIIGCSYNSDHLSEGDRKVLWSKINNVIGLSKDDSSLKYCFKRASSGSDIDIVKLHTFALTKEIIDDFSNKRIEILNRNIPSKDKMKEIRMLSINLGSKDLKSHLSIIEETIRYCSKDSHDVQ